MTAGMQPKAMLRIADPGMPWLHEAMDRQLARRTVGPVVSRQTTSLPDLVDVELVRHKPGRRAVIRYVFACPVERCVYAKIRARGPDRRTHRLHGDLRQAGLEHSSGSIVEVPAALGIVPSLNMTLQAGGRGRPVGEAIEGPDAAAVMAGVASSLHRLHAAPVEPSRSHDMADELGILDQRLADAAHIAQQLAGRIAAVLEACKELAGSLSPSPQCGIHRDFYFDQILVDGPRYTLLDLDLYARGDPALDVGNFSAHLTELSLRRYGTSDRYALLEAAFEQAYLAATNEVSLAAIEAHRILSLARHIQLSMVIPGRSHATEAILAYCEQALGTSGRARPGARS